jgi:hypothetical protein
VEIGEPNKKIKIIPVEEPVPAPIPIEEPVPTPIEVPEHPPAEQPVS